MAKPKKKPEPTHVAIDPDLPCMTEAEVFRARAFIAEAELAEIQAALMAGHKKDLIKQLDPEGKLEAIDVKIKTLLKDAAARKEGYNNTIKAVGDRLGLPMDKYGWDDETGVLRLIGAEY